MVDRMKGKKVLLVHDKGVWENVKLGPTFT
jgi:hypothetical protein